MIEHTVYTEKGKKLVVLGNWITRPLKLAGDEPVALVEVFSELGKELVAPSDLSALEEQSEPSEAIPFYIQSRVVISLEVGQEQIDQLYSALVVAAISVTREGCVPFSVLDTQNNFKDNVTRVNDPDCVGYWTHVIVTDMRTVEDQMVISLDLAGFLFADKAEELIGEEVTDEYQLNTLANRAVVRLHRPDVYPTNPYRTVDFDLLNPKVDHGSVNGVVNEDVNTRISELGAAFSYRGQVNGGADEADPEDLSALYPETPPAGDYYIAKSSGWFELAGGDIKFANAGDGLLINDAGSFDVIDNSNTEIEVADGSDAEAIKRKSDDVLAMYASKSAHRELLKVSPTDDEVIGVDHPVTGTLPVYIIENNGYAMVHGQLLELKRDDELLVTPTKFAIVHFDDKNKAIGYDFEYRDTTALLLEPSETMEDAVLLNPHDARYQGKDIAFKTDGYVSTSIDGETKVHRVKTFVIYELLISGGLVETDFYEGEASESEESDELLSFMDDDAIAAAEEAVNSRTEEADKAASELSADNDCGDACKI